MTDLSNILTTTISMDANAIVVNPSTTTVVTFKTVEFASTIIDHSIPIITLPPVTEPFETTSTDVQTAIRTYQPTITLTQTSVAITYYLQNTAGAIYSTSTTGWLIAPTQAPQTQDGGDSFHDWSAGAKAGLITGVVFAALLILFLLICCYKRNARWIAHDWRWAPQVEGGMPGMANANMAHPVSVASPMTIVSTTPSYQYGYPSYCYMRGGASSKNWFGRLADKLRKWKAGKARTEEEEVVATPIRVLRELREASRKREAPEV